MRDILFRGKRKDNGEWVYGYYFERKDTQGNIIESVIIEDAYEQITSGQRYVRSNLGHECSRVIPETVGQFTGLTDKYGKEIFEGDIVEVVHEGVYKCRWDDGNLEFGLIDGKESFGMAYVSPFDIAVIGNIYDNPELLEVEHEIE